MYWGKIKFKKWYIYIFGLRGMVEIYIDIFLYFCIFKYMLEKFNNSNKWLIEFTKLFNSKLISYIYEHHTRLFSFHFNLLCPSQKAFSFACKKGKYELMCPKYKIPTSYNSVVYHLTYSIYVIHPLQYNVSLPVVCKSPSMKALSETF